MKCLALVVETSGALSKALGPVFGREVQAAGSAVAPDQLLEAVLERSPSLVIAEISGPEGELAQAIELTMAEAPTPIVLVVQTPAERLQALTLLAAGALDVAMLPARMDVEEVRGLVRQFQLLSRVKVVKHPRGRRRRPAARPAPPRGAFPVVAVAASLGGPRALATLLADLPRDFGAPVLVCQHITAGFSDDLARWLAVETGRVVREAAAGDRLERGEVYVAPSNVHLVVEATGVLALEASQPVGGFRPSCDVLLRSVGQAFGGRAIGVVLTGMGRDGAKGLKEIRARGGHTIAQAEKGCVVFGMPKEAIALGGAEKVLPLEEIADQLARWVP